MLKFKPAVFAVGKTYQIMVPVTEPSIMWIEVGGRRFYDEQNGIMRSLCTTHRVSVPAEVLDEAKRYTVVEQLVIDRKPYFPEFAEPVETNYDFHPLPGGDIRIYHISDTHNRIDEPVAAAKKFGQFDLLVMNGDIPDHSGAIANFDTIYAIADALTGGTKPIAFARGNHDMRGYFAEQIAEHTPNHHGHTYFTARIGSVWALILDCGEDKIDGQEEYGPTVACHGFRERQTEFIREIIENSAREYDAPGVEHKLVICHNPFTHRLPPPFDIEDEIYTEWARLLREHVKPELMLCGHLHRTLVCESGGELDHRGQPCKMVIGSNVGEGRHVGCGIVLRRGDEAEVGFFEN